MFRLGDSSHTPLTIRFFACIFRLKDAPTVFTWWLCSCRLVIDWVFGMLAIPMAIGQLCPISPTTTYTPTRATRLLRTKHTPVFIILRVSIHPCPSPLMVLVSYNYNLY